MKYLSTTILLLSIAALLLTRIGHAGDLATYRKPICETAEDFAGCMANKKPQMWRADAIRWDCRHGFEQIESDDNKYNSIRDEEVDFITTIVKTPTYKACQAYRKCIHGETKEKHCYINDKRWRGFHTGWW
jgi:hypothetical protein